MEVVLSPGRFGDEPGAPFQNEEIREWSHVDRLTGMLERARVETGRWKTLNQGAARSYGKVIDSRERNSADGSIVQKARRQVEVFQSEAPGRSVQVVRASQWSSSRVTDSSTTIPLAITSLAQNKTSATPEAPQKLVASSNLGKFSPSSLLLTRDEAISERLSTLLGSFAHHISSSTVPLRRIDSKYATRTPISRRSTSNDDLVGHSEKSARDFLADRESSGEPQNPHYQKFLESPKIPRQIEDCFDKSDEENPRHKIHEINIEREETEDYNERLKIHEVSAEREASRDYKDRLGDSEDSTTIDNCQNVAAVEESRPTTNKAAIQLLPSSKANTTVVNLINDSNNSKPETMDIREGKRSNILSWVSSSSSPGEEIARSDAEEATTTPTTTSTSAAPPSANSPREPRIEESVMPFSSGRSVKRVGFCKTEIHFAADSGKVNIVETDEKPPPTNKFRRRKRNSLNGLSGGKNLPIEKLPIVDTKDSLEQQISRDNNKPKNDPILHRGHTTSVNLGNDLLTINEQTNREHGIPTEASLKPPENSSTLSASSSLESEHVNRQDLCNVVCTDAENNQVLLKVVTTHEPTIARVEIDHFRNSSKTNTDHPIIGKKEKSSKKSSSSGAKKLQLPQEHTYVNVFTGSKKLPIYENYKVIDSNAKLIADSKIEATDSGSAIEKKAHVTDPKIKAPQSSGSSGLKCQEIGNAKLERVKVSGLGPSADGKLPKDTEFSKSLLANKKARNKTKESKSTRVDEATCNIKNRSTDSNRGRSIKVTKNSTSRSSASSGERGDDFATGSNIHAGVKNSIASKSQREATSAKRISKGDVLTKQKPIEVVYQTAVYNMKNEKLKKPQKGKESKGPRYLNELICGVKIKRPSDSKTSKTSAAQNGANNKSALQPIKHWK